MGDQPVGIEILHRDRRVAEIDGDDGNARPFGNPDVGPGIANLV
ncbi:hypothetical protein BN961_01802 [Afipia felis]|uniref:Uncharacterized protein n=1 Tax=Afipia felis TaxID=1035 RepID=A0A090MQA1_AFIFE|nr:hypothetical protein BN961_01802 [Afipia felis]